MFPHPHDQTRARREHRQRDCYTTAGPAQRGARGPLCTAFRFASSGRGMEKRWSTEPDVSQGLAVQKEKRDEYWSFPVHRHGGTLGWPRLFSST